MNPERKHPVLAAIDYARALANHRPPPGLPIAWVSSDLKRRLQSDPTSPYYRPDLYPDPNHDRNPTMNADVAADVISIVKCSKCGKHFEKNDYGCPFCALNFTEDQLNAAMARLPAGMEHCTILFKECAKGHGRLTAANWIDHGCPTCKIQELEAKLKQAGELKPADDALQIVEQSMMVRKQSALIRQIAAIFGYHGNRNGEELVHYLELFRRERDELLESLNDKHAILHQIANLALSQCQIADTPKPEPVDEEEEEEDLP